ncbi:hypothetical protein [Sorangium sp. So ce1335]|uniref:hypothetical protein n=1 Tax=Sorangium sp. So ce1335 TaxID=3133335 RepID=UPI003F5E75FD
MRAPRTGLVLLARGGSEHGRLLGTVTVTAKMDTHRTLALLRVARLWYGPNIAVRGRNGDKHGAEGALGRPYLLRARASRAVGARRGGALSAALHDRPTRPHAARAPVVSG